MGTKLQTLLRSIAKCHGACAAGLLFLAACSAQVQDRLPAGPWRYAEKLPDCFDFKGDHGKPANRTIILDDAFSALLLSKLPAGSVPSPRCWYEKPDGSLFLRAGNFCENPHWVTFAPAGNEWFVSKVEDPFVSCNPQIDQ
jgi:hypothetical protein